MVAPGTGDRDDRGPLPHACRVHSPQAAGTGLAAGSPNTFHSVRKGNTGDGPEAEWERAPLRTARCPSRSLS